MQRREKVVQSIESVIQANIANPSFGVNQLAEEIGISVSYLREITWIEYDMSPRFLIETIRIETALNLLSLDHQNLCQISKQTGFNHPKTFRRTFQRRLDISPSECKENLMSCKDFSIIIDQLKETLWERFFVRRFWVLTVNPIRSIFIHYLSFIFPKIITRKTYAYYKSCHNCDRSLDFIQLFKRS